MENKKGISDAGLVWLILAVGAVLLLSQIYVGANYAVDEEALADLIGTAEGTQLVVEPVVEVVPDTPVAPVSDEPEVIEVDSSNDYKLLAMEEVIDEFEDEDRFLTCDGHEFDDDEYDYDIEDVSITTHNNGDVTVTLDVEFDFDDNSDERDCKEDRTFEVFWDEDDVEDEDWGEAKVKWLKSDLAVTA